VTKGYGKKSDKPNQEQQTKGKKKEKGLKNDRYTNYG